MPRFGIIIGNTVVNVILADSKEMAEEITGLMAVYTEEAVVGSTYDAETGTFTPPPPVELPYFDPETGEYIVPAAPEATLPPMAEPNVPDVGNVAPLPKK